MEAQPHALKLWQDILLSMELLSLALIIVMNAQKLLIFVQDVIPTSLIWYLKVNLSAYLAPFFVKSAKIIIIAFNFFALQVHFG